MSCYFHPNEEGVATCAKCGVSLCRSCESNAFFRLDGKALCNRCSLEAAESDVRYLSSWLKKRVVKLVFCAIFVLAGIISYMANSYDTGTAVFALIVCWFISGIIANIGVRKPQESIKSQLKDAAFEYEHPFSNMIIGIIVNTIFGPIALLANLIGYIRTKANYKNSLNILNQIRASM